MFVNSIREDWERLWQKRFHIDTPRLRFELGGEELSNLTQQIPRFLQAHGRSTAIVRACMPDETLAIVGWYPGKLLKTIGIERSKDGFDALFKTGFEGELVAEWQAYPYRDPDDDEPSCWSYKSYTLDKESVALDTLIWHAVANEMPIYPSLPLQVFLLDQKYSVLVHIYDDRGMDVIADQASALTPLYRRFSGWLLDFDRPRMARIFEGG